MFGLWKARRGRRAATAMIAPFVDGSRQRLGGIPDSAWRDPYLIGFVSRLITLFATREVGSLDADDLASVQARGWKEVTGTPEVLIGEEICFLSASRDNGFVAGCREAEAFFQALGVASNRGEQSLSAPAAPEWADGSAGRAVWSRCFDAHLG